MSAPVISLHRTRSANATKGGDKLRPYATKGGDKLRLYAMKGGGKLLPNDMKGGDGLRPYVGLLPGGEPRDWTRSARTWWLS